MIAYLFPGQGSQTQGCGRQYRETAAWPWVGQLAEAMNFDLEHLLLEADEAELRQTANTQAAAFCRNWLEWILLGDRHDIDLRSAVFVGHSMGEYSALAAAGALDVLDSARAVGERGRSMAKSCAAQPTSMIAITGADCLSTVEKVLAGVDGAAVSVANINSPMQIVIAGTPAGAARVATASIEENPSLRSFDLPVGGAFHTHFKDGARDEIEQVLLPLNGSDEFAPVISNVTGSAYTSWDAIIDHLVRQVVSPVRWDLCSAGVAELGVDTLWESAPKKVLSGFVKRCVPNRRFARLA